MNPRESEIEKHFCWAVATLGGVTYKFRSPTQRGVADRIALLPGGKVWFVELKRPGGKLSPLQELHRDEVNAMGCNHAVLWSKAHVETWMRNLTFERSYDAP